MSKQIHCPECQTENTPGSKFCNSCGARLPKSTSVLCPKCQTPNPHNNFYCDNCGGRLRAEQNNVVPEEPPKPEASDLPTSAKMFTLPTRDPGDTGELDPASLPNWLKNQGDEIQNREDTGKLPRLSDLTPEERKKGDDLPGWLINTENEDLLIGSPDDITTEHFLHLIQDINEEERKKLSGLLNDPAITGNTANLPDWLKDVA
ncbi:MAG: zinc ribbon domain-containing protein, partial [Anaerolineae bacterium]|nr:zinc ribbon domain-containing protein [Anaerolineae bacterium]